jgi:flagellar basal-body rod protein FlgC
MSFLAGFRISSSGMSAQRTRLNVTASNLANAETTRTEEGGPYLRRDPIFASGEVEAFDKTVNRNLKNVEVSEIRKDTTSPTRWVHDPEHPDANEDGYVEYPNVDIVDEMVNMTLAARGYEANATSFETLKRMAVRALGIGA